MNRNKKMIAGITAGALTLALIGGISGPSLVRALWDKERAVHIDPDEIESSTLIIGTHLVHLSAMNECIYDIAEESAGESGQTSIYYKSELADNAWFDITSAASLTDITTGGTPVTDEVIEKLFLTHHTKSDQKTYDLRTGEAVNIFDLKDPYDKAVLDELQPLKMHYDFVMERDGNCELTDRIEEIFDTEVKKAKADGEKLETETIDKEMEGLQNYLDVLTTHKAEAAQIEKVNTVMEQVDASRRFVVFANLEKALNNYLRELNGQGPLPDEDEEGDEDQTEGETEEETEEEAAPEETDPPDPALLSAVSESLQNVENAMIKYQGMMLVKGTTTASEASYTFTRSLVDHAVANDHAACDRDVQNLIDLDHIQEDTVARRAEELALLENVLIPMADQRYLARLSQGESGEYLAEKNKNSAQVVLDGIIRENDGKTNAARGELEFFLEAKCSRIDTKGAMDFIQSRLEKTDSTFAVAVPPDAFEESCQLSVQAHRDYLTQKHRSLELAMGGNEMDKLAKEKEDLQQDRMSALDKNDLATAKKLDEEIAAVDDRIRTAEQELGAQSRAAAEKLDQLEKQLASDPDNQELKQAVNTAKSDLDQLNGSLRDGSLGKKVAQLQKTAQDGLARMGLGGDGGSGAGGSGGAGGAGGSGSGGSGGTGGPGGTGGAGGAGAGGTSQEVANAINTLAELMPMDPGLVAPALQEVYHDLQAHGGDPALLETMEKAILDNPYALTAGLSTDELIDRINGLLAQWGDGLNYGNVSGKDAGALLVGLQQFYDQTRNNSVLQLLSTLAWKQYNMGEALVFNRINDVAGPYLPQSAIQAATGRRLVWDRNQSRGTLSQGSDYYSFTLYSTEVLRDREGKKTELMERMTKNLNGLHIPGEYAREAFQVWPVYLSGTDLGVACDKAMEEKAQQLLELLSTVDASAEMG